MSCDGLVDMEVAEHDDGQGHGKAKDVQAQDVRPRGFISGQVVKSAGGLKALRKEKTQTITYLL